MPRRRLGVALLVEGPVATEIDGLRRACGDGARERVPPHLTLVPPVNVHDEALPDALRVLRAAAGAASPITVNLGPVTTFSPDTPTVYLAVGGDREELDALGRLRDAIFVAPLARPLTWPFVPHVTIAEEMSPERIDAAVTALSDYAVTAEFHAVHLLEEQPGPGRRWSSIADYHLRPPITVARGGLPLELVISDQLDPEARDLVDREDLHGMPYEMVYHPPADNWRPLVVTARRRGTLVGLAAGFTNGEECKVASVIVGRRQRGQGIARHLYARFVAEGGRDVNAG